MKAHATGRGSALIIVLWALILLSAAVLAWAQFIQNDIQLSGQANRELEARAMAHSGIAIALHPLVSQKTPLLERQFGEYLGYRVRIVGEGGKLNINWLIAGEDPEKLSLLILWLEQMELDFQERNLFIDSLLDYVDGDDIKRLNGIEDFEDYHPANRPLQSVDELRKVANSELLTSKPGWREQLTVYSGGQFDITAVNENILKILPGVGESRMQRFLEYRRGKDQLDGTIDDPEFKTIKEAFTYLGVGGPAAQDLAKFVVLKDQTMHITSEGTSAKVIRQVEVVARKGGANPAILSWKE